MPIVWRSSQRQRTTFVKNFKHQRGRTFHSRRKISIMQYLIGVFIILACLHLSAMLLSFEYFMFWDNLLNKFFFSRSRSIDTIWIKHSNRSWTQYSIHNIDECIESLKSDKFCELRVEIYCMEEALARNVICKIIEKLSLTQANVSYQERHISHKFSATII